MPAADALSIPEIRGFLAVRSGLTVQTAAEEAGLTTEQLTGALARIGLRARTRTRRRTR